MKIEHLGEKLEKLKHVVILLQDCYTVDNEKEISDLLDKVDLEIERFCTEIGLDYKEEMEGYY